MSSDDESDTGFKTVTKHRHSKRKASPIINPNETPKKQNTHTTDSESEMETNKNQKQETEITQQQDKIQKQVEQTKRSLQFNKPKTTPWHVVITGEKTLSMSLMDEAIARYSKGTIITNSKLTQSKRSIFYKFENPSMAFNSIYKHLSEISAALSNKLKITHWQEEPPKQEQANKETTHCIAKNIPTEYTEQEIMEKINPAIKEQINKIARIKTGIDGTPTSFVRIICKNTETAQKLIQEGILLNNRKFPVVEPRPQRKITQCFKCQAFGHYATDCKDQTHCGKCGQKHKTRDCPHDNTKTEAVCANCKKAHPAWSTSCPVYQQQLNKQKQKEQQMITKQQNLIQETKTEMGSKTWANIAQNQSQQTTEMKKISEQQAETKQMINKNETNIRQIISQSLDDLKTQIRNIIQDEIQKFITELREQIKTDIQDALRETATQISEETRSLAKIAHEEIKNAKLEISGMIACANTQVGRHSSVNRDRGRSENTHRHPPKPGTSISKP